MKIKIDHRFRRTIIVILALIGTATWLIINPVSYDSEIVPQASSTSNSTTNSATNSTNLSDPTTPTTSPATSTSDSPLASAVLEQLAIKGRAPKTDYARTQFYNGWPTIDGCSLRQRIIKRDFGDTAVLDPSNDCNVIAGEFIEPYTGSFMKFTEKSQISKGLQIDHIVALSDAWQKGAQNLTKDERYNIATDPLNLVVADGPANMQKGDGDAATWLPSNKSFRCQYVARQVSVKYKYHLWVTQAEHDAISGILEKCPTEPAVGVSL